MNAKELKQIMKESGLSIKQLGKILFPKLKTSNVTVCKMRSGLTPITEEVAKKILVYTGKSTPVKSVDGPVELKQSQASALEERVLALSRSLAAFKMKEYQEKADLIRKKLLSNDLDGIELI